MIVRDEKFLTQVSAPVSSLEEGIEIAEKLLAEVKLHKDAIGLSAIQIGIPKRVFVQFMKPVGLNEPLEWKVWINPEIEKFSEERMFYTEGCLSFPGISVRTNRPKQITVTDIRRERFVLYETDAIVFQHEFDHVDGILFFERRAKSVPQSDNVGKEKVGRNDLCPCGSGKKYKRCCGKE
jgi:peptide deformylase